MIHQLRIYEIFEHNKAAFHARFRDHAARIMRTRYDFQIVAMWESRFGERTEFVYVLEWPDEAAKTAGWTAFMGRDQARHPCRAWADGRPDRGPFARAGGLFAGVGARPVGASLTANDPGGTEHVESGGARAVASWMLSGRRELRCHVSDRHQA